MTMARRDVVVARAGDAARRWSNLGAVLWRRFETAGDVEALRECLDASRRAADADLPGYRRIGLRHNVLRVLIQLYAAIVADEVLDEALGLVAELVPEPGEHGVPDTVELAEQVFRFCESRPGPPLARYAEARRRFVTAYADLSLSAGQMLVKLAEETGDANYLQQGARILDEALEAPTDDLSVRAAQVTARARASAVRHGILGDPTDLDDAIEGFPIAMEFVEAGGDVPPGLHHSLALSYSRRYERDGDVKDVSAAIAVRSAEERGEGQAGREWQSRMHELHWDRYQATADLDDLDTAIDLGRRLVPGGEVRGLSQKTLRTNLCHMLAVRQLYRENAAVTAEIAELCDVLGSARFGEVLACPPPPWVRTYEDGPAVDPVVLPAGAHRVLFLRTFKDPAADVVVLRHLAATLGPDDRVVLLSDARDESALVNAVGDRAELVATTDDDWPRVVHAEMAAADAIVLHLSPKDLAFPRISRPPDLTEEFPKDLWEIGPEAGPAHQARVLMALRDFVRRRGDTFDATPLSTIPTGAGLLRELAYLARLNRLARTVVVVDNRHFYHFSLRREEAWRGAFDGTTVGGQPLTPRLTALEQQLGELRDEIRGVTFSARLDGGLSPAFSGALGAALADVIGDRPTMSPAERERAIADLPLGVSPLPRRLPPDGELKIIGATPVEDLVEIPIRQFVEIPQTDIRRYLTDEIVTRGCPRCGAPLDQVFFYTRGLVIPPLDQIGNYDTHGKCQACGRRSTVTGRDQLLDF
jgi:hypothetical protein